MAVRSGKHFCLAGIDQVHLALETDVLERLPGVEAGTDLVRGPDDGDGFRVK
jgi:hypothetical protein